MDLLAELVFIIMQRPPKQLDKLLAPKSKMRQFFDLLLHGKAATDEEAAMRIYGTPPRDKRYLMLKRNLANKLTEIVLEAEYFDRGNIHSIQFECEKELTVAMKLLLQNVFHTSEKILQRIKILAQQYHLTKIEISCLLQERTIASLKGQGSEVALASSKIDELAKQLVRINQSTGWVELLQSRTRYFISKSSLLEEEAKSFADSTEAWMTESPNIFLQQNLLYLRIIQHLQTNNLESIRQAVLDLGVFFEANPQMKTPIATVDLYTYLATCARMEGNMVEFRKAVETCLELTDYKAFNRFGTQVLHFDLLCKEGRFDLAGEVLLEVKKQPQYDLIYTPDKVAWDIRKAYLYYAFISKAPELVGKYTPEYSRRVDINGLSNNSKFISKDKQGLNLMLSIIRVLLLMEINLEEQHHEGENLRIYYYRHLKHGNCERTKIFTRALYKLLMGNLNQAELRKCVSDFTKRLQDLALHKTIDNPELIRYEVLGEMIVSRLQQRIGI